MFTIEVEYTTGGSFHTERCKEEIALAWKDIGAAKAALAIIEAHYKLYLEMEGPRAYCSNRTYDDIFAEVKRQPWFQNAEHSEEAYASHWYPFCAVQLDDGSWRNLNAGTWCGYFEKLHRARIVVCAGEGLEIKFGD